MKKFLAIVAILALVFSPATSAFAASADWTGGANDGLWATAGNWTAGGPPGSLETATFNAAAGGGGAVIDLDHTLLPAGIPIGNIVFDPGAVAYTIGSGVLEHDALTLDAGGAITMNSNVLFDQTFNATVNLAGAGSFINGSTTNTLNFAGAVVTDGVNPLTVNGAGNTNISGAVSGASNITKAGSGMLTLSGNNSYTGTTTITNGTVVATNSANALGQGAASVTLSGAGATLSLSDNTGRSFNRNVLVSDSVNINSDTSSAAAGVTHTLGTLNIGANTLTVGLGTNATSTQGLTFGVVTLTGGATINANEDASGGLLTLASVTGADQNLTIGGTADTTISGAITTGAGGLTKNGSGTLTLADGSTYAGKTAINGGTVKISNDTGLGTAPGGTVADQLSLNTGTLQATDNVTLAANRGITLAGAGTLSTDNTKLLTVSGNITNGGNTLTVAGAGNTTIDGVVGFGGGAGGLTKTDGGVLTLSGANLYKGVTAISGGTVKISADTGLGDLTQATNTVSMSGGSTLESTAGLDLGINRAITLGAGGATLKSDAGTLVVSGTVTKAGNLLTVTGAGDTNISGAVSGGGGVTKTGAGSLVINNATNAMSGDFTLTTGAGKDATVVNTLATNLATSNIGQDLFVTTNTAGGNITDSNTVTVGRNASFTTSATGSGIDLGTLAVAGTVAVNTNAAAGNDVSVVNATALTLAASNVGGDLSATASTGDLTDSNTVTVGENASFTTLGEDKDIDLGTLAVTGKIALATNSSLLYTANATITNATGIDFDASGVDGNLSATATTGTITQTGGALIVAGTGDFITSANNQAITLNNGSNAITGDVTFTTNSAGGNTGNVTIDNGSTALKLGTSTIDGSLSARSGEAITDTGVLTVATTSNFRTDVTDKSITLDSNNVLNGAVTLNTTGTGDASLKNTVTTDLATSGIGRDLTVTATTGNIIDSGTVTVGRNASFTTSTGGAVIDLGTLAVSGNIALSTTGPGGNATVVNTVGTTLAASTVGGNLNVSSSNNSLVISGALSTAVANGSLTLNAGGGTLTANAGGTLASGSGTTTLTAATIDLNESATTVSGLVDLNATTSVDLDAAKSITTTGVANAGVTSGAIDVDVGGTGTANLAGNLVTTGAANNAGTASAGGAVNVDTVDGAIAVNAITTTGGAATAGDNNGGAAGAITLNTGAGNTITLNGNLTAVGGAKSGAGTQGAGGDITVSDPALLGHSIAINSGTGNISLAAVNTGGNTLTVNKTTGAGTATISGVVSNTGAITKEGTGTLNLNAANTYSGATTVNGGTLKAGVISVADTSGAFGKNSAVTMANAAGASLDITGFNTQIGSITGGGGLGGNVTLGAATLAVGGDNSSPAAYAGVISGTGTIAKIGTGTQIFSGTNTYSGKTTVAKGALSVGNVNATATNAQALGENVAVDLGVAGTSSGTLVYTGGAGTLAKNINALGNGSDTIQNAGAGVLILSGTLAKNGTVLTLKGGNGINVTGSIQGSSANSDLIIDGGTTTLSSANTYNGPTFIINGATLNANVANALPTENGRTAVRMDQSGTGTSTLALGANQSIASLTGAVTSLVNLNARTLTIGTTAGSTDFAGVISGIGGLTKDGASTQIFSGANDYTGTTSVAAGTLDLHETMVGAVGDIDFTGDATLRLLGGKNLGRNITTDNGNGTLIVDAGGNSAISGTVGTNLAQLKGIEIDLALAAQAATFSDEVYAGNLVLGGDGSADFTAKAVLGGSVTTALTNKGKLALGGNGSVVTGDVGTDLVLLREIEIDVAVAGQMVAFEGDVFATTTTISDVGTAAFDGDVNSNINFTGNGVATIATGKNIFGTVTADAANKGTLNFEGDHTTQGAIGGGAFASRLHAVNIENGTLTMDDDIAATTITVDSIGGGGVGTLKVTGNRTIYGNLALANSGVVDLGTNTLQLLGTGNYNQPAGTTLKTTILDATVAGNIDASAATSGTITTALGSTVSVTVPSGAKIPVGTKWTIIDGQVAGGVFVPTTILSSNPRVSFGLNTINGATGLELEVLSWGSAFTNVATDGNGQAVGAALEAITDPTGDMANVLNTLDGLTDSQLASALDTMVPDVSGGAAEGSRALTSQGFTMISNRLGGARDGGVSSGVSSGDTESGVGVWVQGLGSHMKQDERKGIEGYKANTFGTTIGADKVLDNHFRAGLAGSYGWAGVNSKQPGKPSDNINSWQGTLYASYDSLDLNKARQGGKKSYEAVRTQVENSWYVDGMFAFTQNNYDSRREIWMGLDHRIAKADHNAQQYSTNLEAGYKFVFEETKSLEVTPFASLGYNFLYMNQYKEHGADALSLNVQGEGYHQLEQALGTKFAYPLEAKDYGTFIPSAKAAWLLDYIGDRFETTANFAGGGPSFNSQGAKPAQNGMLFGAELAFLNKGNVTVTGNWDIELKDQYMSNTYYGTVRYDF